MNNNASNQSTVTMEQAIRSAITAAVHQVKSKVYERDPEDPVQAFLDDLFAVLFPTAAPVPVVATMPPLLQRTDDLSHTDCESACCTTQEVTVPVSAPEAPAKEKKPRKKKADSPASTAEKKPRKKKETPPTTTVSAPPADVIEVVVHAPEPAPAPAKEKKPRKKKADSPAPATPPTAPAPTEAPPAAPKKEKKVKSPKPEGVNLDKLTPTQVKKLKAVADELHVELDKKAFLAHLNLMSAEDFGSKTLEAHYRSLIQPPAATPVVEQQDRDLDAVEVTFNGKTYYVDESDMRVYEQQGEVSVPVGYVGMAAFKDLVLPQES